MTDLKALQQAAVHTTDANGHPVVVFPAWMWEEYVWFQSPTDPPINTVNADDYAKLAASQAEQLLALMEKWEQEPDDTPPEWWNEFDQFLRDSRHPERALQLTNEETA